MSTKQNVETAFFAVYITGIDPVRWPIQQEETILQNESLWTFSGKHCILNVYLYFNIMNLVEIICAIKTYFLIPWTIVVTSVQKM